MSDTTLQNCNCCEIEDDCIDGLCQCCSLYNQKLQKQSDLLTLGLLQKKNKYDTLKASHAKLKKYAQHKDDCNLMSLIPCVKRNGRKISCTYGLDKALAEAEKL